MCAQKRLPGTTLERILQTARKHFALKGFSGTRVDEIAKDAKVNKAMIYYHFKNKEDLYRTVFMSVAPFSHTDFDDIILTEENPQTKLRNFICAIFNVFEKNPEFVKLAQWELASGPLFMPVFIHDFVLPVVQKIWKLIEDGIREGEFRPVDPFLTYFHTLGLISEYFFFRPVREEIVARRPDLNLEKKFDADFFKNHLINLVFHGIMRKDDHAGDYITEDMKEKRP